jgi:hypothetical protein
VCKIRIIDRSVEVAVSQPSPGRKTKRYNRRQACGPSNQRAVGIRMDVTTTSA